MATSNSFTIKDITNIPPGKSNTTIGKFLNTCREYYQSYSKYDSKSDEFKNNPKLRDSHRNKYKKLNAILDKIKETDDVFCKSINVGQKEYLSISRKIVHDCLSIKHPKLNVSKQRFKSFIKFISGSEDEYDFLELNDGKLMKNNTKAKQDFTCLAIWYVINYPNEDFYGFYDYLLTNQKYGNDNDLSITNRTSTLQQFIFSNNHSYLIDSFATASTIIKKLNLIGTDYIIAEEDSPEGNKYKKKPYYKLSGNESNYYTGVDKLTTADIYIIKKKGQTLKKLHIVFEDRGLTHKQYLTFINKSFKEGELFPISLKKVPVKSINQDFTCNLYKIINPPERSNVDNKDKDPYQILKEELQSIKNKTDYIKKLEEIIDIDENSFDYRFKSRGRTTFLFTMNVTLKDEKKKTYENQIFMQSGQYYIKPKTSSSASGIGGMARDYLNDQILKKLSNRGTIFLKLRKIRLESFGETNVNRTKINALYTKFPGLTYSNPVSNPNPNKVKEEAIRIGETTEKTWNANYKNNKDAKKKKSFYVNLINKIADKTLYKRKMELVNAIVDAGIMSKIDAVELIDDRDIKKLAKIIKSSEEYKGLKSFPILKISSLLTPGNIKKVIENIPTNERVACIRKYTENLTKHLGPDQYNKIQQEYNTSFANFLNNPINQNISNTMCEKLSSFELMYVFSSSKSTIMEWIKNSVIMSMYSLAGAGGVVIFGNPQSGMKSSVQEVRKNPVYIKIGN
jgi:hypothetical protein